MPAAGGNNGGIGREPIRRRPLRDGSAPQDAASPEEVHHQRESPTRSDYSRSAFEYHAALLGDNRSSQLSSTLERAMIVRQLQRDYGNRYVQRLVDHISRKRAEGVQTKLTVGPAGDHLPAGR